MSNRTNELAPREALIATPIPMLAWLRGKDPNEIVATSKMDVRDCLLARFFKESGYHDLIVGGVCYGSSTGEGAAIPIWFRHVFHQLPGRRHGLPITASEALAAFDRAEVLS